VRLCSYVCIYTLKCMCKFVVMCVCMYSSIPVDRYRAWICMYVDCKQIGMCPCVGVSCYMPNSRY